MRSSGFRRRGFLQYPLAGGASARLANLTTAFAQLDKLGAEHANRRYFADRTDGFRAMGPGQVLAARV